MIKNIEISVLPSASGLHYTDDNVTIIYAVSRFEKSLVYSIDAGDQPTSPVTVTSFAPLATDDVTDSSATAMATWTGGTLVHRYATPGTYTVTFAVAGPGEESGDRKEEDQLTATVEVVITRRRTLQASASTYRPYCELNRSGCNRNNNSDQFYQSFNDSNIELQYKHKALYNSQTTSSS